MPSIYFTKDEMKLMRDLVDDRIQISDDYSGGKQESKTLKSLFYKIRI